MYDKLVQKPIAPYIRFQGEKIIDVQKLYVSFPIYFFNKTDTRYRFNFPKK